LHKYSIENSHCLKCNNERSGWKNILGWLW